MHPDLGKGAPVFARLLRIVRCLSCWPWWRQSYTASWPHGAIPEPSERAAHQDIHGYHGRRFGVLPAGVRLRVARAQRSRVRSVVQLLLTALIGLAATRICRAVFCATTPRTASRPRRRRLGFPCQALAEEIENPLTRFEMRWRRAGIRTPDTFGVYSLAGEHLRPLGQLSAV